MFIINLNILNKFMIFIFLFMLFYVFPLFGVNVVLSSSDQDVFSGPRPVYYFHLAEFVRRVDDTTFVSLNASFISEGKIVLDGRWLNSTHAEIRVSITGYLQFIRPGSNVTISNTYVLSEILLRIEPEIGRGEAVIGPGFVGAVDEISVDEISAEELEEFKRIASAMESEPFSAEYTYIVDARYNYAYIGGEPIGFFPLYSLIDIRYEEALDYRFTYLGKPLLLSTTKNPVIGQPYEDVDKELPITSKINYNGNELVTLLFINEFLTANVIHNYIAFIQKLVLPVGNDTYIVFGALSPDPSMVPYLSSIDDDYPWGITTESFVEEIAIAAAAIAVASFILYRRRSRSS